jgi:hypothetical protein
VWALVRHRFEWQLLVKKAKGVLAVLDQPSRSFLKPPENERRKHKE